MFSVYTVCFFGHRLGGEGLIPDASAEKILHAEFSDIDLGGVDLEGVLGGTELEGTLGDADLEGALGDIIEGVESGAIDLEGILGLIK